MPFLNFGGNKISIVICPTWISLWKIWKIGTRIRIHFGTGSGSTFSKCGSEDPDPLLRKGGSEDPDPLFPNVDPRIRIRIHVKMRWIRNAVDIKGKKQFTLTQASMAKEEFLLWMTKFGLSPANRPFSLPSPPPPNWPSPPSLFTYLPSAQTLYVSHAISCSSADEG